MWPVSRILELFDEVIGIHGCWEIRCTSGKTSAFLALRDKNDQVQMRATVYHDEVKISIGDIDTDRRFIPISEFINLYRTDLSDFDKIALILKYT